MKEKREFTNKKPERQEQVKRNKQATKHYRIRQNIRGGKLSWFSRILAKRESFTIESFPSSQLENLVRVLLYPHFF